MTPRAITETPLFIASVIVAAVCIGPADARAQTLSVRNNQDLPYRGPIEAKVALPDGHYSGAASSAAAQATAEVRSGIARIDLSLSPASSVALGRSGAPLDRAFVDGPLSVVTGSGPTELRWSGRHAAWLDFGLAAVDGTTANVDDAITHFSPLAILWTRNADGTITGTTERDGYAVSFSLAPYASGTLDVRARVARAASAGAENRAYLALIRRVTTLDAGAFRLRFNGREMPGPQSPSTWDRDFWYTRGVDWTSWRSGALSFLSVNGFAPVPTIMRDSAWVEASHFYVWERTRQRRDSTYLVSEIAGPNPDQSQRGAMGVTQYAPLRHGDTVSLKWRLAIGSEVTARWGESQLRGFAGYRTVSNNAGGADVSLGVPSVTFGTSYFPYSTLAENFDFYRTPGLSSEGFWPVSTKMWTGWRAYVPRMETDFHIIKAMGFDMVRLHHLELLRGMKREDALAFLDFYADQARSLGLELLIDSEGPEDWISMLLTRYRDVVTRVELENEILIPGIKRGDRARWIGLYAAAKRAAPDAQVFLTSAGNNGMFARLVQLGVPFDRVGLHAYKHGPQWKEAYSSHILGTAGYASDIGKPMTLGEFNWKDLTRMSPEARRAEVATIYETVLAPRAIPEFFEFQFQESLTFNPAVAGSNSRHYEPLAVDRRPKPEAFELISAIRKYGRADAPVRELPVAITESRFAGGKAVASYTVTNSTAKAQTVQLRALAYDGVTPTLSSSARLTIPAGASASGRVSLALAASAPAGTYHHFLEASYGGKRSFGWGIASNPGAPTFSSASVLADRVRYPQGAAVINRINWKRPLAVAFGATASVLELEDAYQLGNTLQSATGRPVRVSSIADLPDSLARSGTVLLVGTPATNTLIASVTPLGAEKLAAGNGEIRLEEDNGRQWLVLTGFDSTGVEAAVVELELRYWPSAKDAAMRITGMERGAALGNRAGSTTVDPP
jgi:hypothetical protein